MTTAALSTRTISALAGVMSAAVTASSKASKNVKAKAPKGLALVLLG